MHIRLPDKHVASHFCLQAFLSEQSFPSLSLSCSSAVILLLSIRVGAASSNFTRVVCRYRLDLATLAGFFLPVGLAHHIIYVSYQDQIYQQYYYKYIYPELQLVFSVISQEQRCSNIAS